MRIEINRWRMAGARDIHTVAVGYNCLVPVKDCVPNNPSNRSIIWENRHYMDFPDATWSTDLPPSWARYSAWLEHERAARRRMLGFLHKHCPETRMLDEWPTLWADINPRFANKLHTVHFTIPWAPATPERAAASAA